MRYAVYHTPEPTAPLSIAASAWFGRDAFGRPATVQELPSGWSKERHAELVREPRRYGFHATVKAPFALADNATEQELLDAFSALTMSHEDIVIPSLVLCQVDGFFALVPEELNDMLNEFAGQIVRAFDRFRAPLTHSDIERRNPERLNGRQRAHLERWGYPFVFEEFFFHMTLTGRVNDGEASEVRDILEKHFSAFLGKPHTVSTIAIFVEPEPGEDFAVRSMRPVCTSHLNGKA